MASRYSKEDPDCVHSAAHIVPHWSIVGILYIPTVSIETAPALAHPQHYSLDIVGSITGGLDQLPARGKFCVCVCVCT